MAASPAGAVVITFNDTATFFVRPPCPAGKQYTLSRLTPCTPFSPKGLHGCRQRAGLLMCVAHTIVVVPNWTLRSEWSTGGGAVGGRTLGATDCRLLVCTPATPLAALFPPPRLAAAAASWQCCPGAAVLRRAAPGGVRLPRVPGPWAPGSPATRHRPALLPPAVLSRTRHG